ncbi:unnamed protein product [Phyllotreta striolata]|uniref:Malate dehydrogenase n=1 Tax=Phyllotreta striolata TaxID=444603 RepID=A0A9N9TZA5_PHYSR|nr:unnamed protein product [Phyllotreta striolata]
MFPQKLSLLNRPLYTRFFVSSRRCFITFAPLREKEKPKITKLEEAHRFIIDCFVAVGTTEKHAEIMADNLTEADLRGHYSHGMNRLEMYLNEIDKGLIDANAKPQIEKESPSTAVVNGNNGLGAVNGNYCMNLAIKKASKTGAALVVCRNSNHYGIAAIYCLRAIRKGFLGFSCTNTSPLMVPTRAKNAALGTNPIAIGVPGEDKSDYFLLDFASTNVAIGKIELMGRKGGKIPKGWALNEQGQVETDPHKAFKASRLLPLGGEEKDGGYKGYGLGMLVEIFCGILSGSAYGPTIRPWGNPTVVANLGHCFLVVNPRMFTPGVKKRMSHLMNLIRKMEPADPKRPVMVHGDFERVHMMQVSKDGGVRYVKNQHDANKKLAERLDVEPMQSFIKDGKC